MKILIVVPECGSVNRQKFWLSDYKGVFFFVILSVFFFLWFLSVGVFSYCFVSVA